MLKLSFLIGKMGADQSVSAGNAWQWHTQTGLLEESLKERGYTQWCDQDLRKTTKHKAHKQQWKTEPPTGLKGSGQSGYQKPEKGAGWPDQSQSPRQPGKKGARNTNPLTSLSSEPLPCLRWPNPNGSLRIRKSVSEVHRGSASRA